MGVPENHSLQELAISAFHNNYHNAHLTCGDGVLRRDATLLQPSLIHGDFTPSWEFNPANYTILAEWSATRDYLDEDDFFTLGFRPQDEITTELWHYFVILNKECLLCNISYDTYQHWLLV